MSVVFEDHLIYSISSNKCPGEGAGGGGGPWRFRSPNICILTTKFGQQIIHFGGLQARKKSDSGIYWRECVH